MAHKLNIRFVRATRVSLILPLWMLMLLFVTAAPILAARLAQEQGPNRAGLVVVHGDGRIVTRCVSFEEPEISGVTLLNRSGLAFDLSTGPLGATVCTLNGEGCPVSNCFCECQGTPCAYWVYFHHNPDGSWTYSSTGAAAWQVRDGDADAWAWSDGSVVPPTLSFEAICGDAAPVTAPSPTAEATSTLPSASPTITVAPTATAPVTATAEPTATDEPADTPAISATSTATRAAPTATETPEPTATSTPSSSATPPPTVETAVTATPTMTPQPRSSETDTSGGPLPQYLVFIVLLSVIGGAFLLLRRRSG